MQNTDKSKLVRIQNFLTWRGSVWSAWKPIEGVAGFVYACVLELLFHVLQQVNSACALGFSSLWALLSVTPLTKGMRDAKVTAIVTGCHVIKMWHKFTLEQKGDMSSKAEGSESFAPALPLADFTASTS